MKCQVFFKLARECKCFDMQNSKDRFTARDEIKGLTQTRKTNLSRLVNKPVGIDP